MKDTLIINAADIYGLDHTIVKGDADALSDIRSENHRHFVRCHPSQFYAARSETQIPEHQETRSSPAQRRWAACEMPDGSSQTSQMRFCAAFRICDRSSAPFGSNLAKLI